jgi:hypothetical protein
MVFRRRLIVCWRFFREGMLSIWFVPCHHCTSLKDNFRRRRASCQIDQRRTYRSLSQENLALLFRLFRMGGSAWNWDRQIRETNRWGIFHMYRLRQCLLSPLGILDTWH